jgi:fucose 4-O-acetylase-like acetyltransferase
MTRIWSLGDTYNDLLTALGVFLITINICKWIVRFSPKISVKILSQISKESYLIYLMHGSVILFVAKPLLAHGEKLPLHPFITIILSGLYCVVIFVLAKIISPAMGAVSSRFYDSN